MQWPRERKTIGGVYNQWLPTFPSLTMIVLSMWGIPIVTTLPAVLLPDEMWRVLAGTFSSNIFAAMLFLEGDLHSLYEWPTLTWDLDRLVGNAVVCGFGVAVIQSLPRLPNLLLSQKLGVLSCPCSLLPLVMSHLLLGFRPLVAGLCLSSLRAPFVVR